MENINQDNEAESLINRITQIEDQLNLQEQVLNICVEKWYATKGMLAEAKESNNRTQNLFILAMKKLGIPWEEGQISGETGEEGSGQSENQNSTTEIEYRPPVKPVVEKRVGNLLDSMRNPGRRNGYRQGY